MPRHRQLVAGGSRGGQRRQVGAGVEGVRRRGHRLDRDPRPSALGGRGEELEPPVVLVDPQRDAAPGARVAEGDGGAAGLVLEVAEAVVEHGFADAARGREVVGPGDRLGAGPQLGAGRQPAVVDHQPGARGHQQLDVLDGLPDREVGCAPLGRTRAATLVTDVSRW